MNEEIVEKYAELIKLATWLAAAHVSEHQNL
jgi:hypothetical protein